MRAPHRAVGGSVLVLLILVGTIFFAAASASQLRAQPRGSFQGCLHLGCSSDDVCQNSDPFCPYCAIPQGHTSGTCELRD